MLTLISICEEVEDLDNKLLYRVTRSLVLYVCFVDHCLSFCTFSFGHCVVCSSTIYDSDYPFGIFKLFIQTNNVIIIQGHKQMLP